MMLRSVMENANVQGPNDLTLENANVLGPNYLTGLKLASALRNPA